MSSDFFPSAMLCQFSCGVSRSPLCGVNSKNFCWRNSFPPQQMV